MKWQGRRQSTNVVDRRGASAGTGLGRVRIGGGMFGGGSGGGMLGGGGGMLSGGVGVLVIIVIAGIWLFSGDGGLLGGDTTTDGTTLATGTEDELKDFVDVVVAETEDTWNEIFAAAGRDYPEPTVYVFSGSTGAGACGLADAATGPFYCPPERAIFIDLAFYDELRTRFGAPGDFAQAYVIAHEVGHHVQNLLGTLNRTVPGETENQQSVRAELQADCYAGIWARRTERIGILDPGDIEEAMTAAQAIGDDAIQGQAGRVRPDTFTHGTSAQRTRWFNAGYQNGTLAACDTFGAATL